MYRKTMRLCKKEELIKMALHTAEIILITMCGIYESEDDEEYLQKMLAIYYMYLQPLHSLIEPLLENETYKDVYIYAERAYENNTPQCPCPACSN